MKSDGVASPDGVGQGKLYSPDQSIKIATKHDENVGQGKLYSPDHAIKISEKPNNTNITKEASDSEKTQSNMLGVKKLVAVKDKVLEKLAAASVPSESLENAKLYLEGVIKEFAGAAQGMTKGALHRIKTHLAVILPSVSPTVTGKMVDDAEKEAIKGEEEDEENSNESSGDGFAGKSPYVSPTSSLLGSSAKSLSRL